ncbi:hypothetical protein BV22DRAFT_986510, partial [Leucogyrophana mollusca]
SKPFITQLCLYGPKGVMSSFHSNVDNGAMINAIDTAVFHKAARRLRSLISSQRVLRMADGTKVKSQGIWKGTVRWGDVCVKTTFEVFPSGGNWSILIGKPLLEQIGAVHDYGSDVISI